MNVLHYALFVGLHERLKVATKGHWNICRGKPQHRRAKPIEGLLCQRGGDLTCCSKLPAAFVYNPCKSRFLNGLDHCVCVEGNKASYVDELHLYALLREVVRRRVRQSYHAAGTQRS